MSLTFYSHPWGEPTKAVVEASGQLYDIREGWGCAEGWTNHHVAIPLSDEESEQYGGDLLEMDEEEVQEAFDQETLDGIAEAVEKV